MAISAKQSIMAQESILFKSLSEASLDKGPLASRLVHGGVWSPNRNGTGQQGLSHASDGFKAACAAFQAHAAGRVGSSAETCGLQVHGNKLHMRTQALEEEEVDAADSCSDALQSCRLRAHTGGVFLHVNAAYERSDGDKDQPSDADFCGSPHAAADVHGDPMRPTAVHDNAAFEPSAAEGDDDDAACVMSQAASSGSAAGTFARRGVVCVMLHDNELYEAGALQQTTGPSSTTSQFERTFIPVAGPAAATCLLHCAQFGCCERQQEKQQQLRRRRTGGVSVPEHLRPRFMRSTAASRAKAARRDA